MHSLGVQGTEDQRCETGTCGAVVVGVNKVLELGRDTICQVMKRAFKLNNKIGKDTAIVLGQLRKMQSKIYYSLEVNNT